MTVRERWDRRKRIMTWPVLVLLLIVASGCSKWSGGGPSLPSAVTEPASAYDKRLKRKSASFLFVWRVFSATP